uniref:Protein kinase domain-containing protein n=1 Tax=Aureoumbra lagunensis TaxID=44058 RepID=A0A7S3JSA8_9STRA
MARPVSNRQQNQNWGTRGHQDERDVMTQAPEYLKRSDVQGDEPPRKRSRFDITTREELSSVPPIQRQERFDHREATNSSSRRFESRLESKRRDDNESCIFPPNAHQEDEGHYRGGRGDILGNRYEILGNAGTGTFGRVVECIDRKNNHKVAIKIVRRVHRYTKSAVIEADIVRDVNRRAFNITRGDFKQTNFSSSLTKKDIWFDPRKLIVQLHSTFYAQGHYCLVFEKLGISLYELLKLNNYRPFLPKTAARFSYQILKAIEFLHSMQLCHTDLKLENILLRNSQLLSIHDSRDISSQNILPPFHIPAQDYIVLVDFGGATYDYETKSAIISTRQYRAPEVILNLGWSMPSDLWSAGCIVAELFRGDLLFATHSNTCHIGLIDRLVGPFPFSMLQHSKYFHRYFDQHGRSNWPTALRRQARDHVRKMPTLSDYCHNDRDLFDLLKKLLIIDPLRRFSATKALQSASLFSSFERLFSSSSHSSRYHVALFPLYPAYS